MQSRVSAEIRELITDDIGHIRFQNMHNGNSMTVPSQRLRMQLLRSDEWAARLYESYCEIWQTQRRHLSPEFLRAIATHAIGVLVSARKGAVADEFLREQQRTRRNTGWLKPAMDAFARDMVLLLHKWEKESESDARTVQYMLDAAPERSAVNRAAWEVITAKTRIRTLEAGIASIEARSKMAESALNGMLMAETPAYRRANVEQNLSRLKEQRKELRSSLDDWQVRLKVALRRDSNNGLYAIGFEVRVIVPGLCAWSVPLLHWFSGFVCHLPSVKPFLPKTRPHPLPTLLFALSRYVRFRNWSGRRGRQSLHMRVGVFANPNWWNW